MASEPDPFYYMNVAVVTHTSTLAESPPASDLEDFLRRRVRCLCFIGHPLRPGVIPSFFKIYEHGIERMIIHKARCRSFIEYLLDPFLTILFIIKQRRKFNFYIGIDPLNALTGLFLRSLHIVDRVVFYTIDYVPLRFNNRILNSIYHLIDAICVKHCDSIWNLSPAMTKARAMRGLRTTVPQIIVPIGVNLRRIIPRNNRTKIVYAGTLEKMFGVDLVLQAFAALSKEIEGIELIIIGKGSEEIELRRLAKRLGIQDRVKFVGFIQKHSDLEKLVAECGIGVAIYTNDSLTYKRFTDVAKPKLYMACGLPVVITRVPPIAGLIEKYQAGLVINYDIQELKEALYRLLTDEYTYNRCRDNAIKFISMYDWDKIYYEAFLSIMNLPPHVGKRFKAT